MQLGALAMDLGLGPATLPTVAAARFAVQADPTQLTVEEATQWEVVPRG